MPHQRPLLARSCRFSAQDRAVMAEWLAIAAQRGYYAASGTCDEGVEWVGISPPGAWGGEFWENTPEPSGGGFVVLDQQGEPWVQCSDIRGVLRFVAPLPPTAFTQSTCGGDHALMPLEHFWVWGMCWSFEKARLVILEMSVARLWEPG